jgi:acetyltransferase-like isoleucine patch superfamily enzyme
MAPDKLLLHPIEPGKKLLNDWYPGSLPTNVEVGRNSLIDSSFCFKHYYSSLRTGIKIGSNVTIWRASLAAEENAYIEIGDYCYVANASLVCSERISIGNYVFIAGGVTIADSDFHPIDSLFRLSDTIALSPLGNRTSRPMITTSPVIIEDDVWIGYNATILKGVRVGTGATISPGAFVIDNVPPGVTVAGNPAKPVMSVCVEI